MNPSLIDGKVAHSILRQSNDIEIDWTFRIPEESTESSEIRSINAALLASEFSEFISAASRLEASYTELQKEVSELGVELSERNAALKTSLVQNECMRLALQQIVDSMPCGVLVLDSDGSVSIINPESRRLLGIDGRQFEAESPLTLLLIKTLSNIDLAGPFGRACSNDIQQEFCVNTPTEKLWLEVRSRRIFHQTQLGIAADQTILILRDITAQKRSEQEREAGRRAMAIAEISTILAHEIRNPLASLELFAELIEKDEDRRAEWVSHLRAGIRSLSGTVNNVLSFHGATALNLTPISLPVVLGNAVQFARPLAEQAGVSLEWYASSEQVQVMGNASALQQVSLNLISNAIRHTQAGGSVTVSLQYDPEGAMDQDQGGHREDVIAEFSDSGCGIPPDQLLRVFEPGFSGSGDTSGLGLAVCSRIMKQHSGRISVSSTIDSGSRFSLHFPTIRMDEATS